MGTYKGEKDTDKAAHVPKIEDVRDSKIETALYDTATIDF